MSANEKTIRIVAVGDMLLSDGYFDAGYGMGSKIASEGAFYPFEKIHGYFKGADILIGNLECAVSRQTIRTGLRANEFLASPAVMAGLKQAGFDILLVANNHILQHGASAYRDTVANVVNAGIKPAGHTFGNGAQELVIHECDGATFGVLGYSMTEDEHNPVVDEYAHVPSTEKLLEDVREAREKCDQLVVLVHWGDEYVPAPSVEQIKLAHELVDAGVDIILGTHPHVLQAVEVYKGKTIVYSLGNFVFNMPAEICRQSALISIEIKPDNTQTHLLRPVWINEQGQPEEPSKAIASEIAHTMEHNEKNLEDSRDGIYPYEEMKRLGLSIHRQAQKKQFVDNILKIKKKWVVKLLYEYCKRKLSAESA